MSDTFIGGNKSEPNERLDRFPARRMPASHFALGTQAFTAELRRFAESAKAFAHSHSYDAGPLPPPFFSEKNQKGRAVADSDATRENARRLLGARHG